MSLNVDGNNDAKFFTNATTCRTSPWIVEPWTPPLIDYRLSTNECRVSSRQFVRMPALDTSQIQTLQPCFTAYKRRCDNPDEIGKRDMDATTSHKELPHRNRAGIRQEASKIPPSVLSLETCARGMVFPRKCLASKSGILTSCESG